MAVTITGPTEFRYCCQPDNGDPPIYTTFIVSPDAPLCSIDTQPTSHVGPVTSAIDFGGSCTCGTMDWQQLVNGEWVSTPAPTVVTAANIGTLWRFCCENECSSIVTITDQPNTGNVDDRVGNLDPATPLIEEFCAGCPAIWEIRIDDPVADEENPANPVGDRVNSDPGVPEPVDEAWQRITAVDGEECISFSMTEFWPQGVDPDTQGGPNEFFIFYIRASCDGGTTWQNGSLRMEHD